MTAGVEVRRTAFWTLDRFRGGPLARSVADVEAIMAAPRSPAATRLRAARLTRILDHASRSTAFYAGLDPGDPAGFPVVNKLTFRHERQAMLARGLRPETLTSHRTSGSTGTPFEVLWDPAKRRRNTADTLTFVRRGGYDVGMPLFYLRAWGEMYTVGWLRRTAAAVTPVDVMRLEAGGAADVLRRIRRSRNRVVLLGYPSAIEALCRALEEGAASLGDRVAAVIASGEAPSEHLYEAAPRVLGCEVVARYSNTECGILAQAEPGSRAYRVNVASYAVEILRPEVDEPAGPGETGRIVVTDLFNRAMPIIRYDTGDLGAFPLDDDGTADETVLSAVAGRRLDQILDSRGTPLSPASVGAKMSDFDGVEQVQLVQTGPGRYTLRLNAASDPARDARLRRDLLRMLGQDADLEVAYVEEIPLLSSGKRRMVVNEWRSVS